MSAPAAEFSRPRRLDTLGAGPVEVTIEADPGERAALARRFGLIALDHLAARYRLAGVFLILGDPDAVGAEHRCAILDDVQEQRQILAGEGEDVGSARVVRVAADHVVLSADGREETLLLVAGTLAGRGGSGAAGASAADTAKILETTRFGNRVGETRWEINKQAVLEYYQEMMDNKQEFTKKFTDIMQGKG